VTRDRMRNIVKYSLWSTVRKSWFRWFCLQSKEWMSCRRRCRNIIFFDFIQKRCYWLELVS